MDGKYTTLQAADVLGVSAHQVAQLIHAGELTAIRSAGDAFLIDAISVTDYARLKQGRGRPLSLGVAWAVLWLLSGLEADWLSYPQRRRLLLRLRTMRAEELVWLVRKRAKVLRLRVDKSFLKTAQARLVASGSSSRRLSELGLTISSDSIEGYLAQEDLDVFMRDCFAVAGGTTNVTLRVVDDRAPIDLTAGAEMPRAVIGTDLAASSVEREQSAGLRLLEELLDEWRN